MNSHSFIITIHVLLQYSYFSHYYLSDPDEIESDMKSNIESDSVSNPVKIESDKPTQGMYLMSYATHFVLLHVYNCIIAFSQNLLLICSQSVL